MVLDRHIRSSHILGAALAAVVIIAAALVGFSVVYAGKVYPGVSVDGLYLGGLDKAAAVREVQSQAAQYGKQQIVVKYGAASLTVPVSSLGVQYAAAQGVTAGLDYGRQGSLAGQLRDRLRSLLGRSTTFAQYTYNDDQLTSFINTIDAAATQPVANASLQFANGQVAVAASQPGERFDRGMLIESIDAQLAIMGNHNVTADIYQLAPTVNVAALTAAEHQADGLVASPLTLSVNGTNHTVGQSQILSWVDVGTASTQTDLPLNPLQSFYPASATGPAVALTLNPTKVGAYVATLAGSIDETPQNAVLSWQNNALAVATPSHPGLELDQTKATQQIMAALGQAGSSRDLTLPTAVAPAAVNESNLASLGITSLLSNGETTFPGSSAARITNVTVGARQFNDVLLSPGQEFSFGQILGPVGAAQGYLPGLVILGNSETYQYGGGLCQVATTAFRAALLAGLPINQRSNHSYAVSFYTAPYGVPGVDATIYYPQVDLKFTNDTGHYILIQTAISGDKLDFYFYGTKTKTGVIIPPHFIYGTTDATKASQTQFQRQILDLNGNVIKTDTFTQTYAPSTDFPIEQTSNGA